MTLSDYLAASRLTPADFAALIGVWPQAVHRYLSGRTPTRKVMERIVVATEGKVEPNDFYGRE